MLFYMFKKIHINWAALAMHGMSRCLKDTSRSLYFPQVITQLLEKKGPLPRSQGCAKSSPWYQCRLVMCQYVNCFESFDENDDNHLVGMVDLLTRISLLENHLHVENRKKSMKIEYDTLMKSSTLELWNQIGCKWVFKLKQEANGTIDKYKARLVTKDYKQNERIDYGKRFSSVVKPVTIRVVPFIVVSNRW